MHTPTHTHTHRHTHTLTLVVLYHSDSLERLPSLEDPQQQWKNSGFHVSGGACGGGSGDLYPDLMEESSPQESPKEGFPLVHSQSALEPIAASEFGGVTGVGPEMRDTEGLRPSFKRQLSAPSNNETLHKLNDVRRYLQVPHVYPWLCSAHTVIC